jgi:hypothetical protein
MPTPLTNAPTPRPPEERRRKSRTLVQRSVKIHLAGERSEDLIDAQLVDLSASGVGIRMTRPLAPGKEFTLAVSGAQDGLAELHYRSYPGRKMVLPNSTIGPCVASRWVAANFTSARSSCAHPIVSAIERGAGLPVPKPMRTKTEAAVLQPRRRTPTGTDSA